MRVHGMLLLGLSVLLVHQIAALGPVKGRMGKTATTLQWLQDELIPPRPAFNPHAAIASDLTQLIGCTPMVYLNRVVPATSRARVAAKLESLEPMGSVKDRIALSMIEAAERAGRLIPGKSRVLEATSGNTGIGLAAVAAARGYNCTVIMPDNYSMERRALVLAMGAELVIMSSEQIMKTPGGMFAVLIAKVSEMMTKDPDLVMMSQFDNPANPQVHYLTTGPEIWAQTQGQVDIFVAGIGTGGTITGVGQFLKEKNSSIQVAAISVEESPFFADTPSTTYHRIQGFAPYGMLAPTADPSVLDELVTVSSDEAIDMARRLAKEEGLFVGISSGAAAVAAIKLAERPENAGKLIVTIFPSFGERYLSTELFKDVWDAANTMESSTVAEEDLAAARKMLASKAATEGKAAAEQAAATAQLETAAEL